MTKTALVLLAAGAEEIEFVTAVDVLRRAGVKTTVAGLEAGPVKCSRDVLILADTTLDQVKDQLFDAIVLPGGLGCANALAASALVGSVLKAHEDGGRIVAAICASPLVLLAHSIGLGKKITSYPAMKDKLADKYQYIDGESKVIDGNLLTGQSAGVAIVFALALVRLLVGDKVTSEVANSMLLCG